MSLIFLSFTVPTATKQELIADPLEEMYSMVWASQQNPILWEELDGSYAQPNRRDNCKQQGGP